MIMDNATERAHHERHCRNVASEMKMRDVLDFLGEHYIEALTYENCETLADMALVDNQNRVRVAWYMAGLPVPMLR